MVAQCLLLSAQKNLEQWKGSIVGINFYPDRNKMSREIGYCIVLERRDILECFCGSCIFRIGGNAGARECLACEVQKAMDSIGQDRHQKTESAARRPQERVAKDSVPRGREDAPGEGRDFLAGLMNYSKALLLSAVLLLTFVFGAAAVSAASTPAAAAFSRSSGNSNDRMKIMSVLKSRTTDRAVLDKAADKLSTMEGRRLRILSSLCERISEDSHTAGADIAFSLMTVMIVLS